MNSGPRQRSIRRIFLRDIVALVVFTAGTIFAVWFIQTDRIREQLSQDQIHKVADQAVSEFNGFFKPIEQTLSIFRKWGQAGILEPAGMASLNAKFIPILGGSDQISSIMIANTEGIEYFLIRDKHAWLTRSTGLKNANGRVLWQRWDNSGKLLDKWWEKSDYDPRRRPWFQGALKIEPEDRVFWTSPYMFFTMKTFGITASMKWHPKANTSSTYVVALDVPLMKISKTITDLSAGVNGKSFLCNHEGYVLAQNIDSTSQQGSNNQQKLFIPAEKYGYPIVAAALDAWLNAAKPQNESLEFKSGDQYCWAVFRNLPGKESKLLIGVAVPENDFFGEIYSKQKLTMLIAAVILVAGIVLALFLVRKYSYQLKDLPTQTLNRTDLASDIIKLVKNGESGILEFKSTMRMNLKTGKPGKEIELAWIKALVAYMNTAGGILLIGVDDEGNITGIEADNFENNDKCRLHFKNLINQHVGLEFSKYLTMDIVALNGEKIVVIECERSTQPVFLKTKQTEEFYIRSGPSSVKLSVSEVLSYLDKRE